MKILKIEGDRAVVSAGRIARRIAVNFLSNPNIGDYVIVHAGFAIEKIDPKKAEETLKILREAMTYGAKRRKSYGRTYPAPF